MSELVNDWRLWLPQAGDHVPEHDHDWEHPPTVDPTPLLCTVCGEPWPGEQLPVPVGAAAELEPDWRHA